MMVRLINFPRLIRGLEVQLAAVVDMAEECVADFHDKDFLVVKDVFPVSEIDLLYEKAMSNFKELMSYQSTHSLPMGIGVKHCYKEIVQLLLYYYLLNLLSPFR